MGGLNMSEEKAGLLNELIEEGYKLGKNGCSQESEEVKHWGRKCRGIIFSLYGKHSKEDKGFRKSPFPDGKIAILRIILEKEFMPKNEYKGPATVVHVNQTQMTSVINDISLQVLHNIEHSELLAEEKQKAIELFNEVKSEVTKPETNWVKVRELLKKSLDYGLKIAPHIIRLAEVYYKVKG